MTETTIPFDGEVSAFMCLNKADGSKRYFAVVAGEQIELTEEQYNAEVGD